MFCIEMGFKPHILSSGGLSPSPFPPFSCASNLPFNYKGLHDLVSLYSLRAFLVSFLRSYFSFSLLCVRRIIVLPANRRCLLVLRAHAVGVKRCLSAIQFAAPIVALLS